MKPQGKLITTNQVNPATKPAAASETRAENFNQDSLTLLSLESIADAARDGEAMEQNDLNLLPQQHT